MDAKFGKQSLILWAGDLVVIALVTLVGFASHGELFDAGWRMLTTFVPLTAAWLVVGVPAGLLNVERALRVDQLWRPFWGMVVAGPMAVLLRSLFLELQPVIPVFGFVIMGVSAVGMLSWRVIFFGLFSRRSA